MRSSWRSLEIELTSKFLDPYLMDFFNSILFSHMTNKNRRPVFASLCQESCFICARPPFATANGIKATWVWLNLRWLALLNTKFYFNFRVGIRLPTVEVRFEHLTIEADCHVGSRALPTLPNTARNILESGLGILGIGMAKRTKLTILKDASGIIKPSRYIN